MSCTLQTGNRRLLKLADFLETVPRKNFDYSTLAGSDWDGKKDFISCGTQGCALGYAASMPAFRKIGLRLSLTESYGDSPSAVVHMKNVDSDEADGDQLYSAVEEVFGLNIDETDFVFNMYMGQPESTPKQVAKKIRKFVTKREELGTHVDCPQRTDNY